MNGDRDQRARFLELPFKGVLPDDVVRMGYSSLEMATRSGGDSPVRGADRRNLTPGNLFTCDDASVDSPVGVSRDLRRRTEMASLHRADHSIRKPLGDDGREP